MDLTHHTLPDLFRQLGLPSEQADIDRFVAEHRPLDNKIQLADAPFWSKGQSQFLREEITEDAEWAEIVDQLNVLLRA
ncbi:DUF2789 domain-containing protein [Variovorax sp. J22R133]|uniref:DUF2789 domain-containing protein n=1 Tax=Variovorax brevis TaxID=3053503 RepID=UPI002577D214|nr:DUF2789 domain-containing protein [Variovorax sp. J22R133]MDM0113488.1 DUF2789 domain-containing protein [Variovorax sp. J22R133]